MDAILESIVLVSKGEHLPAVFFVDFSHVPVDNNDASTVTVQVHCNAAYLSGIPALLHPCQFLLIKTSFQNLWTLPLVAGATATLNIFRFSGHHVNDHLQTNGINVLTTIPFKLFLLMIENLLPLETLQSVNLPFTTAPLK